MTQPTSSNNTGNQGILKNFPFRTLGYSTIATLGTVGGAYIIAEDPKNPWRVVSVAAGAAIGIFCLESYRRQSPTQPKNYQEIKNTPPQTSNSEEIEELKRQLKEKSRELEQQKKINKAQEKQIQTQLAEIHTLRIFVKQFTQKETTGSSLESSTALESSPISQVNLTQTPSSSSSTPFSSADQTPEPLTPVTRNCESGSISPVQLTPVRKTLNFDGDNASSDS